jgi:hypothetical protein
MPPCIFQGIFAGRKAVTQYDTLPLRASLAWKILTLRQRRDQPGWRLLFAVEFGSVVYSATAASAPS